MSPILSPTRSITASRPGYLCLLQNPLNRLESPSSAISGYLILPSKDTLIPSTFIGDTFLGWRTPCAWNLIYLLADALRTGVPVSLMPFFLLPAEPRPS